MDERDIETIVFESLGEASMCWNPSTGDAVFDSTRAEAIGDRLLAEIRSRITGDRTDELLAERDRLRAVVDALREWRQAEERRLLLTDTAGEDQRQETVRQLCKEALSKLDQLDGSADMGGSDG
jgi:hypothetical protein